MFMTLCLQTHANMLEHQVPEMQRVPLEELCLQIKAIVSPSVVSLLVDQ